MHTVKNPIYNTFEEHSTFILFTITFTFILFEQNAAIFVGRNIHRTTTITTTLAFPKHYVNVYL